VLQCSMRITLPCAWSASEVIYRKREGSVAPPPVCPDERAGRLEGVTWKLRDSLRIGL
jgi:hypothetical protein